MRRGGPNYPTGLAAIKAVAAELDIPVEVTALRRGGWLSGWLWGGWLSLTCGGWSVCCSVGEHGCGRHWGRGGWWAPAPEHVRVPVAARQPVSLPMQTRKLRVPVPQVYGPETSMTGICAKAIEYIKATEAAA